MKKAWTAALCLLLLLLCALPAFAAAGDEGGFYALGSAGELLVEPLLASGEAAQPVVLDADGDGEAEEFYPRSVALRVTLQEAPPDRQVLLVLREAEGDALYYVEQRPGGLPTTFTVFCVLPEEPTRLVLELCSDAPEAEPITVPLGYRPGTEPPSPPPDDPPGTDPPPPPPDDPPGTDPPPPPDDPPGTDPVDPPPDEPPAAETDPGEASPTAAFRDLSEGAWYMEGVRWAVENGVVKGVSEDRFAPDETTSRAMLVTMLYRMTGAQAPASPPAFSDVAEGAWYAEPVRWAAEAGLVTGYGDGRFGPNDPLTREQLAVILHRLALSRGYAAEAGASLSDFADADGVSAWAREAMSRMIALGVIRGTGNGMLSPRGLATRAQLAVMLMRFSAVAP